jgi:hypothetical protein
MTTAAPRPCAKGHQLRRPCARAPEVWRRWVSRRWSPRRSRLAMAAWMSATMAGKERTVPRPRSAPAIAGGGVTVPDESAATSADMRSAAAIRS